MSGEWKSWDVGRIAVMDSLKDKPTGEVMDAVEHELRSDVRRYEGDLRTLADE
jgi:hypothetical protein